MSYFSLFQPRGIPVNVSFKSIFGEFLIVDPMLQPLLASACGATHGAGCKDDNQRGTCDKESGHSGADHEHHCGKCGRIF